MPDPQQPDDATPGDDPYSVESTWQAESQPHRRRSVVAVVTSLFVGAAAGVLGWIICWTFLRALNGGPLVVSLGNHEVPLDLAVPAIAALVTAWIVGSQVQHRIHAYFARLHESELRRAAMTEHVADLRDQLRQRARERDSD